MPTDLSDVTSLTLSKSDPANYRKQMFVAYMLLYGNGKLAAEAAGYPPEQASKRSYELLRDPTIAAALQAARGEHARKVNLTTDRILREISFLALSNIDHYEIDESTGTVTYKEGVSPNVMRSVRSIKKKWRKESRKEYTDGNPDGEVVHVETREIEVTLWDKNVAIRSAMDHLGMKKNIVEHQGSIGFDIGMLREAAKRSNVPGAMKALSEGGFDKLDAADEVFAEDPKDPAYNYRVKPTAQRQQAASPTVTASVNPPEQIDDQPLDFSDFSDFETIATTTPRGTQIETQTSPVPPSGPDPKPTHSARKNLTSGLTTQQVAPDKWLVTYRGITTLVQHDSETWASDVRPYTGTLLIPNASPMRFSAVDIEDVEDMIRRDTDANLT